jgi:hypothetical protein
MMPIGFVLKPPLIREVACESFRGKRERANRDRAAIGAFVVRSRWAYDKIVDMTLI